MKKEELRHDPVHDRIAAIIDYIDNNKNVVIQIVAVIALGVAAWGYYSGLEKDRVNLSKSLVGVSQNAYNIGQVDLSIAELTNIVNEYSDTDAANQALVYLLKDAYQNNNDESIIALVNDHGQGVSDPILNSGFYGIRGNADMNTNDFEAAINSFKKAEKISATENMNSSFKIDLAIAFIASSQFTDAVSTLNEVIGDENISYANKNRAEELLSLANFRKDN